MAKYNPAIHHRRSIRLKGYDYTKEGMYFITLCTWQRECFFERYPVLKEIVNKQWGEIPKRFQGVLLDEFIIMPNHFHGIIIVGASLADAHAPGETTHDDTDARMDGPDMERKDLKELKERAPARGARTTALGDIIGAFKSLCVHEWLKYLNENKIAALGKFWQRNYYEHIIRNEQELERIRLYIRNNPLRWEQDDDNLLK